MSRWIYICVESTGATAKNAAEHGRTQILIIDGDAPQKPKGPGLRGMMTRLAIRFAMMVVWASLTGPAPHTLMSYAPPESITA